MTDPYSSEDNPLNDKALSELYRQAPDVRSPASLDEAVLARAAVQADKIQHTSRYEELHRPALLSRKWVTLAATACVLTLSISLVIQMPTEAPWQAAEWESERRVVTEADFMDSGDAQIELKKEALSGTDRTDRTDETLGQASGAAPARRQRLEEVVIISGEEAKAESDIAGSISAEAFMDAEEPVMQSVAEPAEKSMSEELSKSQPGSRKVSAKPALKAAPAELASSDKQEKPSAASPSAPAMRMMAERPTAIAQDRASDTASDMASDSEAKASWQPAQWVEYILKLWHQGKSDAAQQAFASFKNAYPQDKALIDIRHDLSPADQGIIDQLQQQWQQGSQQ